jgi:hypothetical protein
MNKFLSLILLALFVATNVFASTVMLAWDASTDPTVISYNIYWGPQSRFYTNSISTSNTTCSISNLTSSGVYYFAATCVATNGLESDYSIEAMWTNGVLVPFPIKNFRFVNNTPIPPSPTNDVLNGLVANWIFEENTGTVATDSVTSANLNFFNGPTWVAGKTSKSAINFDGSQSFLSGNPVALNPLTNDMSLSFWMMVCNSWSTVGGASINRRVLMQNIDGNNLFMVCQGGATNNGIEPDRAMSLAIRANGVDYQYTSSVGGSEMAPNVWFYVAMTWDSKNRLIHIYINGIDQPIASQAGRFSIGNGDNLFYVGERNDSMCYFMGNIDYLRLYNRILTTNEVVQIYNLTK